MTECNGRELPPKEFTSTLRAKLQASCLHGPSKAHSNALGNTPA
jgi:hypothetical protein